MRGVDGWVVNECHTGERGESGGDARGHRRPAAVAGACESDFANSDIGIRR